MAAPARWASAWAAVLAACCLAAAVCGKAGGLGRLLQACGIKPLSEVDLGLASRWPSTVVSSQADLLPAPLRRMQVESQADDTMPFMMLGVGDCMAVAFRPMRGRSRRDMSHASCRDSCADNQCIGYTYSPCQRVCTVHGDPARLSGVPDSDGWNTMNGGGRIVQTSGQCGSSCYVRMGPCLAGSVMSSGAPVDYGELDFGQLGRASCPHPWVGTLTLRCGLDGITVAAGRCSRPCLPGSILDRSFLVHYPPILHGQTVAAPCPQGTQGAIYMRCTDEEVQRMGGRCGYNCPQGALKAGEATVQYPAMNHDGLLDLSCPAGYGGRIQVECVDSLITAIAGRCDAHCLPGQVPIQIGNVSAYAPHGLLLHGTLDQVSCGPSHLAGGVVEILCLGGQVTTIYNASLQGCKRHCQAGQVGTGVKAVTHGLLRHGLVHMLDCMPGFSGQLRARCDDGEVEVLGGECSFHCQNGTVTSNSVTLAHNFVPHGGNVTLQCPSDTHSGELLAVCTDGAMLYTGTCGGNCPADSLVSNNATVEYPFIRHLSNVTLDCPYPHGSSVNLRCFDSRLYVTGSCGRKCQSGVEFMNSAAINYEALNHSQAKNYTCNSLYPGSLTFSGIVLATCFDSVVRFTGVCWPDCAPGSFLNNGARVEHPMIPADGSMELTCSPHPTFGAVSVTCVRGLAQVDQGSCGAPCVDNVYNSVMTRWWDLQHPTVTHNTYQWFDCPPQVSGRIKLFCFDGAMTALEGNCGERCPAESFVLYGAVFNSPVMDHGVSYNQTCLSPFSGEAHVSCNYGVVTATSYCKKGCFATNITIDGGAMLFTPDFAGGARIAMTCPEFFAGDVVVECSDGSPQVVQGTCDRHCKAGRYQEDPEDEWDVPYYEMLHGETQERQCPEGMYGNVFLRCDRGQVVKDVGGCYYNCPSGRAFIRTGIVLRYAPMDHDQLLPNMLCPAGFVGSVRLKCTNGEIGVAEGGCFAHCASGGVQGALFGYLLHNENASLVCPVAGTLRVRCFDGLVETLAGECLQHCEPGQVPDLEDDIFIAYGTINHNTNASGTCSGNAVGHKNVRCENGVVALSPLPGERCYKHCANQTVAMPGSSPVPVPPLNHGQRLLVRCPEGLLGTVVAQCFDGAVTIIDGACGNMNCPAGRVTSGDVEVAHPMMNNGRRGGPSACPAPYMGEASFECRNGSAEVVDVTLWLPPWEVVSDAVEIRSSGGTSTTTTTTTTSTTTTTTTLDEGLGGLTDDYRFLLCGCCVPPTSPAEPEQVAGVDYRTVVYWAAAIGGSGLLLAAAAGGWLLRPESCKRRKQSRVAPMDKNGQEVPDNFALQDLTKQDLRVLERELEDLFRQKALLEDLEDKQGLQAVAAREMEILAKLGGVVTGATLPPAGLQAALALEDSPKAPGGTLALEESSHGNVAHGTMLALREMALQELETSSKKKVTGFREPYKGEWRHW